MSFPEDTMTARDFIASLAPVDLDRQAKIFRFLAEHTYELRLSSGHPLRDSTDFRDFLFELSRGAELAHQAVNTHVAIASQNRPCPKVIPRGQFDDTCPRCGHVHQGSGECGEQMGGGRICRCETEVPA
jgi:hypothetical protein